MANPTVGVQLTANIRLTSTASGILGNTVQENKAINVYQSLMYTFDWNKQNEAQQIGILSANDLDMVSYTITGNQISSTEGNVTEKYSKSDKESRAKYLDESNKNYVELKNLVNIATGLYGGVTIDAQFNLNYAEKSAITAQFAERTDVDGDTSGTNVIGYSNISSSPSDTANSSMSNDVNGTARYFSTEENMASLQYDAAGKQYDDFGELGINANDLSESEQATGTAKVETVAYYSLDSWSSIKTPEKMRLNFELFDKKNNYGVPLEISDYLTDFKVYTSKDTDLNGEEPNCTVAKNEKKYIYTIDLNDGGYQLLDYNEARESYTFYVDFEAKTGKKSDTSWFENLGKYYQNYMVKLTVELLDDEGNIIPGSNPDNHIIFTNARISPDIIDVDNN